MELRRLPAALELRASPLSIHSKEGNIRMTVLVGTYLLVFQRSED